MRPALLAVQPTLSPIKNEAISNIDRTESRIARCFSSSVAGKIALNAKPVMAAEKVPPASAPRSALVFNFGVGEDTKSECLMVF